MTTVRLTTDVWVSAYLRRCQGAGAFGAILTRGDRQAGAIFIEVAHASGSDLYAPAWTEEGRAFERVLADACGQVVNARIEKERAFDRDLWVVTIEDRDGRNFLLADELV